jgi:ABC-2 type transport system ATP-binding protein
LQFHRSGGGPVASKRIQATERDGGQVSEPPAVEVRELTRVFARRRRGESDRLALDKLDLCIPVGEVHGLLGPNGAGKTTLCKILSTVLLPTSGHAAICGADVVTRTRAVRPMVGIVFGGERGLYTRLTPRQNLRYWAAQYQVPGRTAAALVQVLLDRVGLADRADDRTETLSRGMKQRLHLARGLVGDPRVVILDEPTTGMDPVAAYEFRRLVAQLRDEGRTVLLTTHDMAEAEAVCDRVSLIDRGRLLRTENPRRIGEILANYDRVDAEDVPAAVLDELRVVPGVTEVHAPRPGVIRVHTGADGAAHRVLGVLIGAGVSRVSTSRPSLEEVYLHLVGGRGLNL